MELREFVKAAIIDIVHGLEDAQAELGDMQNVGHTGGFSLTSVPPGMAQTTSGAIYSVVNFDVAVTTVDATKGGGGIQVLAFKAGGEVEGRAETSSRVQFATTLRVK